MLHAGRSLLLLRNADNKLSAPPGVFHIPVNPWNLFRFHTFGRTQT